MKRTTYLKIMGIAWCIPQMIVMLPFVATYILCSKARELAVWAEDKSKALTDWLGNKLFPPTWWPSHRYFDELEEIRAAWRKEAVDRLHSRVAKEKP